MAAAAAGAGAGAKVLGAGKYGVVITPALPNENATGALVGFPGMVTKIMYDREDYEKEMRAVEDAKTAVPELNIGIQRYRKHYTAGNIDKSLKEKLDEELGELESTNSLYLMRMPNLGNSMTQIQKYSKLQSQISALSPSIISNNILKLMYLVKKIKDKEYIHGDVRDMNIMCNTTTGDMNIIDFGFFNKRDTVINDLLTHIVSIEDPDTLRSDSYNFYYSYPPELILYILRNVFNNKSLKTLTEFMAHIKTKIAIELETAFEQLNNNMMFSFTIIDVGVLNYNKENNIFNKLCMISEIIWNKLQLIVDSTAENGEKKKDKFKEYFDTNIKEKFAATFDSYGLGEALYAAMFNSLKSEEQLPLRGFLLDELLPRMRDANYVTRLTIEEAIERMERFMGGSGGAGAGAGAGATTAKTGVGGARRRRTRNRVHRRNTSKRVRMFRK